MHRERGLAARPRRSSRRSLLTGAAWAAGAVALGRGSFVVPPAWGQSQPHQGRHRHRPHRPHRLRRQGQRQRGEDGGQRHQRQGRGAGALAAALHRGHGLQRVGGGEQRPQAHPARPRRRGVRRHHQLDAQRHQGRDRRRGGETLYIYPQLYEGQECTPYIFCTGPDPGPAVRRVHPVADQERRQAVRAPLRELHLAQGAQPVRAQGHREPTAARSCSRSTIRSTRSSTARP